MLFDAQVLGGSQSGRRITSRLGGYSNRSDRRSMQVRERPQTTADADADADARVKGEIPSYLSGKNGGTQAASKQSLNHSGYSCNIKQSRTLICPSFLTL